MTGSGAAFYAIRSESLAFARALDIGVTVDAGWGPETDANLAALAREGLLGPDVTLLHANALEDRTWRIISDSGMRVALCPKSDMQLGIADTTPPIDKATEFGVEPALCVDVECSLGTDLFAQLQAVYTTQRMRAYRRRHLGDLDAPEPIAARTVVEMATVNGARANGVADAVGTLSPGKQADVIMLDAENVATMPLGNAVASVVVGVSTKDVDTVLVAAGSGNGTAGSWDSTSNE
jgi:cytosine/adenosine deaminase-related metal-dependent hydrolase